MKAREVFAVYGKTEAEPFTALKLLRRIGGIRNV
jgi:hypothetical protein